MVKPNRGNDMDIDTLKEELLDSAQCVIADALRDAVIEIANDMFMDAMPSKDGKDFDINLYDEAGNHIKHVSLDWLIYCYFDSHTGMRGVSLEAKPMYNVLNSILNKVESRIEKHGWGD